MIKARAKINLYKGENKRQAPFTSGYRPLFSFIQETKTSGKITILNGKDLKPGDSDIVEITFLNKEYLGKDFGVGTTFKFYESKEPLGEGEILEVLKN